LGGDGGIQLKNNFLYYENDNQLFELKSNNKLESIDLNSNVAPFMVDIDSDGDLDLFVGDNSGSILYYNNKGDKFDFNFEHVSDTFSNIDVGSRSSVIFFDVDNDMKSELIIGSNNSDLKMYKQSMNNLEFNEIECITIPHIGLNSKPFFYRKNNKFWHVCISN